MGSGRVRGVVAFILKNPFKVFKRSEQIYSIERFHMTSAAAMLVSQTSPVRVELFSYANVFSYSNKFAWMLAT